MTGADAPGSKPDPVELRQTTVHLAEFTEALHESAIDPDDQEVKTVFRKAGFKGAGLDLRFFGAKHSRTATHVASSFVELGSADGATSALDWFEADSKKPCPRSCATRISEFDVDDIPDARGVRRIATAADIAAAGFEGQRPLESYRVGFTNGALLYVVDLHGRPGSVSKRQALDIASAYYDRLTKD